MPFRNVTVKISALKCWSAGEDFHMPCLKKGKSRITAESRQDLIPYFVMSCKYCWMNCCFCFRRYCMMKRGCGSGWISLNH